MNEDDYTIRPAVKADAETLGELWELMSAQHRLYDEEVWCWTEQASRRWRKHFDELVEDPDKVAVVAVDPGRTVVGFALGEVKPTLPLFTTERGGFVWDLVVHPDHRRRGLGRRVMSRMFEEMAGRGAEDVVLHVACANEPAVEFYKSLGLRPVMYRMYRRF